MNEADSYFRDPWEPKSEDPGWKWVAENVELPPDSELKNFDFELFPLAKFVLEQLCHNEYLRRFTEMLSAQVGKTVTILAYLCWKIVNRPSGVGWYTDTGINAKGDYKTKILPALEACPKVMPLLPADRAKKNNTLIQFGFMNLRVMGAESRANREGKTITEVLCDEVRNYPPGAMEQIDNRFKTVTNWKRILFSSAGDTTNEPWVSFHKGTRHLGFWPCPSCGHKQTFRLGRDVTPLYPEKRECGGFVWERSEKTNPSENVYNFKELIPTIRYECENPQCRRRFEESEKLALIQSVRFEQTNPMADPNDISVHCWEAYMPFQGCSWGNIVMKFLNAVVAERQGNIEPMKVFVTETLGEPFVPRPAFKIEDAEVMKRCGEYSVGEEWPAEVKCAKQITIDVQHGYVCYLYRIFNPAGENRLVDCGRMLDLEEIRQYQIAKKIKDRGVGVDCAEETRLVLNTCLKYGKWEIARGNVSDALLHQGHFWNGWIPLLGDDAEEFSTHIGGVHAKTNFKSSAVDANKGNPGAPRYIARLSWSKPHYQSDLYEYQILGKGLLWEIPKNIQDHCRDYVKQVSTTEKREERNGEGVVVKTYFYERGRHDFGDCELFQRVMSDVNKLVRKATQ